MQPDALNGAGEYIGALLLWGGVIGGIVVVAVLAAAIRGRRPK